MGKYADKVIKQAKSWLGYKESNGTHKKIIDVYNAHKPLAQGYKVKYTDEWCATFVSAVAIKVGYTDIIPTECSCPRMIELLKKKGIWAENENRTPNVGDIIFYDWDDNGKGDNKGVADHVGIVEKVSGTTITVIEGNMNEAVGRRTLKVNGKHIRGYGVPKYDKKTSVLTNIVEAVKPTAKPKKTTAKKPDVVYQVYAGGKWWGEITNYNNTNSNGYAGVFGKEISGIRVKLSNGKKVTVRSHVLGNAKTKWLSAITKWDNTNNGYSGIKGKATDCIAMKASGHTLKYRVHVKNGDWLGWISGYDIKDYNKGLAGAYGKAIDAVQVAVK